MAENMEAGERSDMKVLPLETVVDDNSPEPRHMSCLIPKDDRVVIDVGGRKFSTHVSTLLTFPNTRLAQLVNHYKTSTTIQPTQFFFDRNCFLFEYILDFYRTGELHIPQNRCGNVLQRELDFWGLTEADIASCCYKTFTDSTDQVSTQTKIEKEFNAICQQKCLLKLDGSVMSQIWAFLTYPKASRAAKVYSFISSFLVLLSLMVYMLSTMKQFRQSMSMTRNNTSGVFVEFLIRLIVCPDKKAFLTSLAAFADIAHVIPVFTLHIAGMVNQSFWRESGKSGAFVALQISVSLRVLRLHRFASCIRGFNVLALSLRASLKELALLGLLALFTAIVFAFALFYVEMLSQDSFSNVFYAMWWALITMTSVGYGDFYPTSPLGYILGVLCAFVGLVLISLPVPMVANNFNLYYAYRRRDFSNKHEPGNGLKKN